jgi:hypothetical protein
MSIVIQPYRQEHQPAVDQFNSRLRAGGADAEFVFFRSAEPRWLPKTEGSDLYQEYFLAIDNGTALGGYALKHQSFSFANGNIRTLGYYHHPLSEGIVNKAYAAVGSLLLKDAMNRAPLLYCLGMGGYDRPLPKMLVRLGWSHFLVPFYFNVLNPHRFLKQMQALRSSTGRKLLMDMAAVTGTGWAAMKTLQSVRRLGGPRVASFEVEEVEEFSDWADSLWDQSRTRYVLTAVRDRQALQRLYPASDKHFTRLRIRRKGSDVGWAVVGERRQDAKYGSMRVGSIVDCWAAPENALTVTRAATAALKRRGVDLIVSNQSHALWGRALEHSGFLRAQSNFIFAASKKLSMLLEPLHETNSGVHITRADGDGLPRNF